MSRSSSSPVFVVVPPVMDDRGRFQVFVDGYLEWWELGAIRAAVDLGRPVEEWRRGE